MALAEPKETAHSSLHDVLKTVFGYDSFRGQQEEIIGRVIGGESCCVLMPTGAGKSLCYQIPAICRPGTGIIVSPLIALMQDQVAGLRELGVRAAMLNSALEWHEAQDTLDKLRDGKLDLLYIAPERLMIEQTLAMLDSIDIALIAIDEAHCMSQWGHDFRPEYRALAALRTRYPDVPCIAVTATADAPTRKDIMAALGLPHIYVAGFDRPNITYEVTVKDNPKKQLFAFLDGRPQGESGIVYCLSRRKTEETAAWLCERGLTALPYHAGLDKNVRARHQERFIKEEGIIIVATIAFGMGIDKPDVRFVAHLDLPSNIESYYQETGRAGRDGLPAVAWMAYGMQDAALRRQMIENGDSPEEQKRIEHHKLTALLGYCEAATCRRQILLSYFGDSNAACGNCDTCARPPETIDGTVPAQKILSCIYRTGQIFGGRHIVDILLGADTEGIEKHRHMELSTYGIGTEYDSKTWQSFIRQLVMANLLRVDFENHGSLLITQEGARFLKEAQTIPLRLPRQPGGKSARASRTAAPVALENPGDEALLKKLKALRLSMAKAANLPPYLIFHDKTLLAMALQKPVNRYEFGQIPGVGASKLEKYADSFISLIQAELSAT